MTQPASKRLLTEANAAAQASNSATPLGAALTATILDVGNSAFVQHLNMQTGYFVPVGWGEAWAAACAAGRPVMSGIGDSITNGYFASTYEKTWFGLLASAAQSEWGDGGSGFQSIVQSPAFSSVAGYYPAASRIDAVGTWTIEGTQTSSGSYGPNGVGLRSEAAGAAADQTLTFKNVRGTQVRLYYRKNFSDGQFTWAVDGVNQGTLTPGGGAANYGIALATVADGLHTVTVTSPAANAQCGIYGVSGERTAGLIANRFGRPGGQSSIMNDATQGSAYGKPAQLSGGNLYSSPSDLAIYAYGVNDAYAAVAADTYIANVQGWLRAQREGAVKAGAVDLVILLPHIGSNDNAAPVYYQYAQRLRGLAEHYGAALINVGAKYRQSRAAGVAAGYFGSSETSLGLTGTDSVHPSDAGHAAIADMLLPLVVPA